MNNWSNSSNVIETINNQSNMITLKETGDKIILLDIGESDYVSNEMIKTNKICWRSIWSYLDNDNIEYINQLINMDYMKSKVFGIKPSIRFTTYNWGLNDIVEELYDCKINWTNDSNEEKHRKLQNKSKEEWVEVDYDMVNNLNEKKQKWAYNNYRNITLKKIENTNWGGINYRCVFLKKNGEMCGKSQTENAVMDSEYKSLLFNDLKCCGIHKNQYKKLSDSGKRVKTIEIMGNLDYRYKNGVMCKV